MPRNSPYPFWDRLNDARNSWPYSNGGARPAVNFPETPFNWPPNNPCGYAIGANGLHWYAIDGKHGTHAQTWVCWNVSEDRIRNAQIQFDSDETWWAYSGTPSTAYLDFWSIAAHEIGHALGGWLDGYSGHFGSNQDRVVSPTQTMCPASAYGGTSLRSTETHDRHTIANEYPG